MVTGDHSTTAKAVAESIGLGDGALMDGRELSDTSSDELTPKIADYKIFARVDPADKVKIIEAWKRSGATVAMTGDGVNDAPALHKADIGVAMGSGTDVARESAAMVLTDDNYATIVSAIAEGRRLFNNLRNVVHYLLSANASEVLYVLTGFLIFGHLGEPLLAAQLLWINLMSDAMPAIALGMDAPPRDLMQDQPGRGRDVLSPRNATLLLIQGTLLAGAAMIAMMAGTFLLRSDRSPDDGVLDSRVLPAPPCSERACRRRADAEASPADGGISRRSGCSPTARPLHTRRQPDSQDCPSRTRRPSLGGGSLGAVDAGRSDLQRFDREAGRVM